MDLVTYRHNWGEDRVYFHDDDGRLRSLPAAWTSLRPADPVAVLGAGRSHFRVADLLELAALTDVLRGTPSDVPVRRGRGPRGVK